MRSGIGRPWEKGLTTGIKNSSTTMTEHDDNASDSDLFRRMVGDVRPVVSKRRQGAKPKPPARPLQRQIDDKRVMDNLLSHDGFAEEVRPEEYLEFRREGIQHRVMRKLKRGEYRREAEIDLHGLTATAARKHLTTFLHEARREGWRCVGVIHGKGQRSRNGEPVLKSRLNAWLRHYGDVLAFCSAPRHDGGVGALYVLLKRHQLAQD